MKLVRPICLAYLTLMFTSCAFAQALPAPVASPLQDYLNQPDKSLWLEIERENRAPAGQDLRHRADVAGLDGYDVAARPDGL